MFASAGAATERVGVFGHAGSHRGSHSARDRDLRLDVVQLHGGFRTARYRSTARRLRRGALGGRSDRSTVTGALSEAGTALPTVSDALLLDTSVRRASPAEPERHSTGPQRRRFARAAARQIPIVLAGGLTPQKCRRSDRGAPPCDRSTSRRESSRSPGIKDHDPHARFCRCGGFRVYSRMTTAPLTESPNETCCRPFQQSNDLNTANDRFGAFGGRYVPETLIPALDELDARSTPRMADADFVAELDDLLATYVGRPSPLSDAPRLSERVGSARSCSSAKT